MPARIREQLTKPGLLRPGFALLLLLAMFPFAAPAAQIYQWKDANGVVHFSNNENDVPYQYRKKGPRDVEPLAGVEASSGTAVVGNDAGKQVWETKCASCHAYDNDSTEPGHTGLLHVIMNPNTKFPYPDDVILRQFEKGIRGNGEGMPPINVDENELKALVTYLVKEVSKP